MSNIGIMDPAFFVGKVVLLKWLNDFFEAGYSKVEQTCTGAMHVQIMDAIYPGKVPLGKVNFDAKTEYEYVANYKVLQNVFDSQQITKHVDVARLVKGKFQDNLEMLQWIKHFFDTHYGGQPYNARERREEAKAQYKKGHKHAGSGSAGVSDPSALKSAPKAAPAAATTAARPAAGRVAAAKPIPRPAASGKKTGGGVDDAEELTRRLSQLSITVEGLEKERNFYFGKLREIEILMQEPDAADVEAVAAAAAEPAEVQELKKKVLAILYATDDNAEFQAPEETTTEAAAAAGDEGLLASDELQAE